MAPPRTCCSPDICEYDHPCRTCSYFCFFLMFVVGFFVLLFFVGTFDPRWPHYSIDSISVKNFNTFRAENPDEAGYHYLPGSSVSVFYNYVRVWTGGLPVFLQGGRNVTFLTASLKGARADLTGAGLVREASRGSPVVLTVVIRIPIKSNSWRSWKMKVPVECQLMVDKLFTDAKIRAKECYFDDPLF